jgi:hypothetical protein
MIGGVLLTLGALVAAGGALPAADTAEPAPTMARAADAFLATLDSAKRARAASPSTPRSASTGTSCRKDREGVRSSRCPPRSGRRRSRS